MVNQDSILTAATVQTRQRIGGEYNVGLCQSLSDTVTHRTCIA